MMVHTRWWLVGAVAAGIACSDDPPATPPPADTGVTDTGPGNDAADVTPTDNPQPPTDNPQPPDGSMGCPMGQSMCGDACIDTQTSNAHCGGCGRACTADQSCVAGACTTAMACPSGQTRCGASCVDTTTDGMNCGSCGNACSTGQSCMGGTCMAMMSCGAGQTACGAACVNTMTDAMNCGGCGRACTAGQTCAAGACTAGMMCTTGQTSCSGACVDTMTDPANCGSCATACPTGQRCAAGACTSAACPTGTTNCSGTCADTATSTVNCGSCGRACAVGQSCAAGMCTGTAMCPTGQSRCGEACSDTMTDPANCGSCGRACTAGQVCTAGTCMAGMMMCPTGQTLCAGVCVDTASSAAHCGGCGMACATGQSCSGGACACASGQTSCSGACVDTATSATHCGRCGNACPAMQSCVMGACRVVCPTGQTTCGTACVDTATSATHCGRCDNACAMGQVCTAGSCGCASGQMVCSGACTDTRTSTANCGRCGNMCMGGQTCVAGACTCATPNTMCGARCTDTSADGANCGRCGNICARGNTCSGGMCRSVLGPANDERATATRIDLSAPTSSLAANTTLARNDTSGACACTSGNDVFYTFTLTQPEFVYADTIGAGWDTSLFIQNAMGANLTDPGTVGGAVCNDDNGIGCGLGNQSQVLARLGPGTYFLVLSGCSRGAATIHWQHLPAGNGAATQIAPGVTPQTVRGTTTGSGTASALCCSGGPENSYWWVTCPGTTAATFYATTCGLATHDTELDQRSAARATVSVCNDDVGAAFACGQRSALTATQPAGAGLHTLLVDSCSGAGAYGVTFARGTCTGAQTFCGACVDTLSNPSHCGGCNRQCASGSNCISGTCRVPPANDPVSTPTVIDMARPSQTLTADTTGATHDTSGLCGVTTSGPNVWFRFTLTQREIVYADTVGSTLDTALLFTSSLGAPVIFSGLTNGRTCNDDGGLAGCATGTQSQIVARFDPGTYNLMLASNGRGTASIRFQHLPTGSGDIQLVNAGLNQVFNGTTAGTGTVTSTCCSNGPEDAFWWYSCQNYDGGPFAANTCGRATWDTELDQRSAGRAAVSSCNDDGCGRRSSVSSTIASGPGLHMLLVDGCVASVTGNVGAGAYGVVISRP